MKRLSAIALLAASFTFAACKKEEKKNAPATTETKPAAGTNAPAAPAAPAAGTEAPAAPAAPAAPTDPAAGSAAAGGAAPAGTAPAMSDAEFEATMKQMLTLIGQMGSAVDAAGGDCGKLADGMEKVLTDNTAFIEKMKTYKDSADMQKKSGEWMQNHMAEVMGPGMKIAEASQKCASDAKFAAAMKKMEALQ